MKNNDQKNRSVFYVIFISMLALFLFHCGKSEEQLIRERMEQIGDYAEKRDSNGILGFISDSYNDAEERTIADIESLLNEYFDKYRGIVVNLLAVHIIKIAVPQAEIEAELALSSGAAKLFRKAVRYSGEFYCFHLSLVKEGETWRCSYARWQLIPQEELPPESIKILRDIFPSLF